jgi:intracellular sulfur oxidation DsrE/DsrF family protein
MVENAGRISGFGAYRKLHSIRRKLAMATVNRRALFHTLVAGLAIGMLPGTARAQASPAKNRVVLQVSDNDPGKWGLALNNARNIGTELEAETVDIEIVVYGPGISMLKGDSPLAQRISTALKSGVKVIACENTMRAQHLSYADMLPDIGYVPSGVVELMQKQQQGYAYIRP